mmetsp:Transcript_61818/g.135821  ORF Transcript_61818/g.135821 Transcript_61818/m.135821 type:complete len:87 (+) Transcript_61818:69-329(+)
MTRSSAVVVRVASMRVVTASSGYHFHTIAAAAVLDECNDSAVASGMRTRMPFGVVKEEKCQTCTSLNLEKDLWHCWAPPCVLLNII